MSTNESLVLKDNQEYDLSSPEGRVLERLQGAFHDQFNDVVVFPPKDDFSEGEARHLQPLVKVAGSKIRTTNYAGYLNIKGERIFITSRFSDSDRLTNDFFFNYLLSRTMGGFSLLNERVGVDASRNDAPLEIYASIFVRQLKDAMRKGIMREYAWRSYNDSNVRGILDVSRHVKQNTPFIGRVAYSQREYVLDNPLNELIRMTIEFLTSTASTKAVLDQASAEVKRIRDVTPKYRRGDLWSVVEHARTNPISHAYYHEYRDLQRTCLQILRHETMLYGSDDDMIHGILFDCAALWENYLAVVLDSSFHHTDNVREKSTQYLFQSEGKASVPIYPDFMGRAGIAAIADAKYKNIDSKQNQERDRKDFYQVLSYMFRFDAKTGFLLYPSSKHQRERVFELLEGTDNLGEGTSHVRKPHIRLIKLGMRIPSQRDMTYGEFEVQMRNSAEQFLERLDALVS